MAFYELIHDFTEQRKWSQALVYHYHQLLVMKTRQMRLQKFGFFVLSCLFFVLVLLLHSHQWQTDSMVGTLVIGSGFKHFLQGICVVGLVGCLGLGWTSCPQEEARREVAEHFYRNHIQPTHII